MGTEEDERYLRTAPRGNHGCRSKLRGSRCHQKLDSYLLPSRQSNLPKCGKFRSVLELLTPDDSESAPYSYLGVQGYVCQEQEWKKSNFESRDFAKKFCCFRAAIAVPLRPKSKAIEKERFPKVVVIGDLALPRRNTLEIGQ